jgi:colicin import membrane protein
MEQRQFEEERRKAAEAQRKAEAERLARELAAKARASAMNEYSERIRQRIRSHIILPPNLQGNPEAFFTVIQLPTGEILSMKLTKSSGNPAFDTAVERAIIKSSPLPLPRNTQDFRRELNLSYRPKD